MVIEVAGIIDSTETLLPQLPLPAESGAHLKCVYETIEIERNGISLRLTTERNKFRNIDY